MRMNSIDGRNSIFHSYHAGPCFGCACDIFVSSNSNENYLSYTDLGNSFEHPSLKFGSDEAMTFLSGSFYSFYTREIEVFALENFEKNELVDKLELEGGSIRRAKTVLWSDETVKTDL